MKYLLGKIILIIFQGIKKIESKLITYITKNYKTRSIYTESEYAAFNRESFDDYLEHEIMLADKVRVYAYKKAIAKHIKPGDTVIDLGTGTGILSFFAAREGAKKVYAIDHSDIILTAQKVAKYNNIDNVDFIQMHSTKFTTERPVNVIIHEQMGNLLFEERMVENITDLRDRLLKKDGLIIPNRFELHIEPLKIKDGFEIPFLRDQNNYDIDFSCLEKRKSFKFGNYLYFRHPSTFDYFLCQPQPVYSFDLLKIRSSEIPKKLSYSRKIIRDGRLDGFVVYFKSYLNDDFFLSTSPMEDINTHWLCFILRVEQSYFYKGDSITFELKTDDSLSVKQSWQWDYN